MEGWDWVLDEQGNKVEPINPSKNISGMDEYDKTLNQYYKYYTEEITDTPTNVVDDAPLLETRFNYTSDVLDVPVGEIDEWADDVIKPNKVFNPDSFTRYTREGKEYIWNRTTSFDAKELYERILKNRASDEDITKFFIYLASHSPSTAYAHKPYFQADALSDIVKIGIFSDKPITEVIPMGVFNDEAFFLDRLQSRNSELGPEINKVLVELVTEQGQFTNLKERMRNVIIDAHNKIYKNNPNDYFVLWRGGKLNRFYPWQSMSKSPSSAQAVSYQMNQLYGAGDTVETYLIHKNNMIDLDALGLSFSNEQEIIVLAEAANKPGAKLEQVLIQDDVNKINVSDLPKNGFEIENISKPLADAGQASQDFFDDVVKGINEKYRPKSAYEQIIDLNNPDIYKWQDDYNKLVKEGGNFNQHIFTSIPTFYETQIIKGLALSNLLNKQPMPDNLLKGRYQVLDIGGTEGTWAKALAKNNPNFYVEVLDPLKKAQDVFEEGELVTNAIFRREAFSYVLDDQDKIFDAKAFQPVRFAVFNEVDKYDVVHESMAFQFMDKNRAEQIKFIKENLLNENGIIIIEEKFANNDAIYKANEELKNTFKSKYYTPEQLQDKKFNVLLDMEANQISVQEIEKILGENFANVEQYWDAGNFKGYIASDSDVVNQFVPEINNLEVSLTNHRFSTAPTEKEIKVAVQNKMQQGGTDSKLAAQLAQETVAKNPKLYNTLAKTLTRFGVLGGTALAGLGKIAPALAPGDVAIEKAIEKAVPYLDDAASKLGFGRLKFGNILPTYIAYEIGVALADVAQAALYADSSAYKYREGGAVYNELRQPELDATGKPVKVLGMSAYDYFQTPPGKKQLEEFDFGSQFMNELDQEKISKYSPGWGLTKGLMFLIGEAYKSGTDQTTSDYTTKLKENPASIYNAGFTGSNK
jgi:succinate dehydrogenase flavin-adding protein (antitoxin of CptAB toxin-antitoxin module)